LFAVVLVLSLSLVMAVPVMAQPTEVWVDDDFTSATPSWGTTHFDKIQDGINAVAEDGTVNVANGNYNATSSPFVRITKPLTLIGESRDGVILDGSGTSTIGWAKGIHVTANDVTIKNLTVQNFGAPSYWGYGVLFRDYAHDTPSEGYIYYSGGVVENVKSQNNCYPMYALVNQNLTIRDCLIQNNLGDGMFIARESDNVTITGNTVINSGDHGIWVGKCWMGLGPSDNTTITNNYVDGAREGGITFCASDGATISGNTITNVAGEIYGIGALSLKDGPSNVEAYNNTIYNNDGSWGEYNGTGHGVGIDGTPSNINLHHNNIYGNTGYGVYNYSSVLVTAENNWWGHASGPSGVGPGTGDAVSDNVLFDPWVGQTWVDYEWTYDEAIDGLTTLDFTSSFTTTVPPEYIAIQIHNDGPDDITLTDVVVNNVTPRGKSIGGDCEVLTPLYTISAGGDGTFLVEVSAESLFKGKANVHLWVSFTINGNEYHVGVNVHFR